MPSDVRSGEAVVFELRPEEGVRFCTNRGVVIFEQRAPADNLVTHAEILAITAKLAFEQQISGGDSKPDVWKNWDNFVKRLDELVAATADLAKFSHR